MPVCPDCGDELDDYSECSCVFEKAQPPAANATASKRAFRGSMRLMVRRKLATKQKKGLLE